MDRYSITVTANQADFTIASVYESTEGLSKDDIAMSRGFAFAMSAIRNSVIRKGVTDTEVSTNLKDIKNGVTDLDIKIDFKDQLLSKSSSVKLSLNQGNITSWKNKYKGFTVFGKNIHVFGPSLPLAYWLYFNEVCTKTEVERIQTIATMLHVAIDEGMVSAAQERSWAFTAGAFLKNGKDGLAQAVN